MERTRQEHHDMMSTPDKWPAYPVLALVRQKTGKPVELAYLDARRPLEVFLGNMYEEGPLSFAPGWHPAIPFRSVDEILDNGCLVD